MSIDFVGAAKRIEDLDLPRLGHRLGVGEDRIHMILDVETRGRGHDSLGRSVILFERHIFYRELKKLGDKKKLDRAVKAGLANTRAGGYGKESEQYDKLLKAIKIDETAALKSASWGLGQIMGFNHKLAGYASVQSMVRAFKEDEDLQLEGVVQFILNNKLDDELRACQPFDPDSCRGFANGYNGKAYARNNYHVKLANALGKWSRIKDTPWSPEMDKPAKKPKPPVVVPVVALGVGAAIAEFWEKIEAFFKGLF